MLKLLRRATSRDNPYKRGYDRQWIKASRAFKQGYPCCLGCQAIGVRRQTDVVDHIIPHRGDDRLFWNSRNWQPACKWHHDSIKPELERQFGRGELDAAQLRLDSEAAIRLTRARYKPAIGADGFAIEGT